MKKDSIDGAVAVESGPLFRFHRVGICLDCRKDVLRHELYFEVQARATTYDQHETVGEKGLVHSSCRISWQKNLMKRYPGIPITMHLTTSGPITNQF
jgi:hypothetical protein